MGFYQRLWDFIDDYGSLSVIIGFYWWLWFLMAIMDIYRRVWAFNCVFCLHQRLCNGDYGFLSVIMGFQWP